MHALNSSFLRARGGLPLLCASFVLLYGCSNGTTSPADSDPDDAGGSQPGADGALPAQPDGSASTNSDSGTASPYHELPFSGGTGAPLIAAITASCRPSYYNGKPYHMVYIDAGSINITDDKGYDTFDKVQQQLVVYAEDSGGTKNATTFHYEAYLKHWYFGTGSGEATLPNFSEEETVALCNRAWIPAEITVTNSSGKLTKGKIQIPVVGQ